MDLFRIPILRPIKHLGDSFINEPSSPSSYGLGEVDKSNSSSENLNQSFNYTGNTEKCEKIFETEEFKVETLENVTFMNEDPEFNQDETSKIADFSELSKNSQGLIQKHLQFIEYAEFNIQKANKTNDFDDTKYEIVRNQSSISKSEDFIQDLGLSTLKKSSDSPIRSESPTIKQQNMPKLLETHKKLKLDLQKLNKTDSKTWNTDRKELNFTVPMAVLPEIKTSPRHFKQVNSNTEQFFSSTEQLLFSYHHSKTDKEILEDDRMSAKKRLYFVELELEKAQQKLNYLKNELIQNEKNNFIENSQKLSDINYSKMKLEVFDIKNEHLIKENHLLRQEYEKLMKNCKNSSKTVKIVNQPAKAEFKINEKNNSNSVNNTKEEKEKIEWELRKLGITSQRRAILTARLQELTIQLENLKEKPRLPLFI